jgi:hypothetical protein
MRCFQKTVNNMLNVNLERATLKIRESKTKLE